MVPSWRECRAPRRYEQADDMNIPVKTTKGIDTCMITPKRRAKTFRNMDAG